jgi:tetratricopeptide (TPR) repeat protein
VIWFLALMLGCAVGLQAARDRAYPPGTIDDQVLYVRSGTVMEKAALSYDSVLADVYWVRALQHYGGGRLKTADENRYDLLYPLLDLTTTLDPRFIVAYRFGAMFLAEPQPGGAGRPDLAIALLKKGVAAQPDKWDYYHDIGFVYYWNLNDYTSAAEWFNRGAALPGAPWWLRTYAATMLVRGGDRQASRLMWQQLGESDDEWMRQTAQLRLAQLDALDHIDTLERAVREFERLAGKLPASWQQLTAARLVPGIPVDPTGVPYVLDSTTGEVGVAGSSKLSPLPTEPAAAPELKKPGPPAQETQKPGTR